MMKDFQLSVFGGIKMFFKLKKEINYVLYQRRALLILVDIICVVLSSFLALFIRQEANIDLWLWNNYMSIWVVDVIISLLFFIFFKLYRSLWLFASIVELKNIVLAIIGADITKYLIINHVLDVRLPYSWYFIEPALLVLLIGGNRFLYRYIRDYRIRKTQQNKNTGSKISKVMIVGAGRAGNVLLREIKNNVNLNKRVVCMIDDNRAKHGTFMNGVPIVGNRDTIADNVNKYDIDEIIIALPRATAMQRKEIIDICKETKCKLKVVPGVYQLIDGEVKVSKLREVEIDDLLGRNPIKVDIKQIASYVKDQVVMVTGGGGSIGSELCLQIAKQNPK
ncbi:MAG TPA: nucleoside-diphosphate sugar epimerase, partial [Erysipelotrichaceae bacterium]|nr:nucleoside-diphosphate sugar epimerase [Erysipelotrichaceae bacterium]